MEATVSARYEADQTFAFGIVASKCCIAKRSEPDARSFCVAFKYDDGDDVIVFYAHPHLSGITKFACRLEEEGGEHYSFLQDYVKFLLISFLKDFHATLSPVLGDLVPLETILEDVEKYIK